MVSSETWILLGECRLLFYFFITEAAQADFLFQFQTFALIKKHNSLCKKDVFCNIREKIVTIIMRQLLEHTYKHLTPLKNCASPKKLPMGNIMEAFYISDSHTFKAIYNSHKNYKSTRVCEAIYVFLFLNLLVS